ncbi:capsular biosynthesis protein, partial [Campylobacter sp. MIT 99-7217]|uniref:CDP-glycerol glycerophosphotransferase family protein n=1 Tax=Campylobacter sp. MIT 99-7217 TaxID=535091 RepID=UPI001159F09C
DIEWVTFTDPDDFLDRDYFYEVDRFLRKEEGEDLCLVACKLIFYREAMKIRYKDSHSLNYKFKKTLILENENLGEFIQLAVNCAFFSYKKLEDLKFPTTLPKFEDAFFLNHFLLLNLKQKTAFLKSARYYYTKRFDKSSTMDNFVYSKALFEGYLSFLKLAKGQIPAFMQNVVLYDLSWFLKENELDLKEKTEILELLKEIFALIETNLIMNSRFLSFKERFLILNLKEEALPSQELSKQKTKLWLLADMPLRADDNAEHLYRFIRQNHPEQKIAFVLRKTSPDYERLKNEGFRLVDPKSLKFKFLLLKADKLISSHIDRYFFEGLGKKTLLKRKFVFLQHGVIQNNISHWLNQRKIDLFITSTKPEYKSIINSKDYKFSAKEVKLTGLARHDALLQNNKTPLKQILVMPTWRQYLSGNYSKKLMQRRFNEGFFESEYFKAWQGFLKSEKLKSLLEKYDFKLIFNPHPQIKAYLKGFFLPKYIQIADENVSLQELFISSKFMITDYSSVAFEMAYLGKSTLYYQFDEEEFFSGKHWQKGYFDYRKDGFSPVCVNENELFKELEALLQNEGKASGIYANNIKNTFKFKDGKCCERIYKQIRALEQVP